MDPKFRSSFIPRTSATPQKKRQKRRRSINIINIVATIIFVASLAASGGLYVYQKILLNSINEKGQQLQLDRSRIDQNLITDFEEMDQRLKVIRSLLDSHLAVSQLFEFLESATVQEVKFDGLSFDNSGSFLKVSLQGVASGYNALALQSKIIEKTEILTDPVYSSFKLDDSGNVLFSLSASVDPGYVLYSNLFNEDGSASDEANEDITQEEIQTDL